MDHPVQDGQNHTLLLWQKFKNQNKYNQRGIMCKILLSKIFIKSNNIKMAFSKNYTKAGVPPLLIVESLHIHILITLYANIS